MIPVMTHGIANRVCLVFCAALVAFGIAHSDVSLREKVVEKKVVVNRNTEIPDGTMTRAECARLVGMTFQQVIYLYGLPHDFDRTDAFFDSLHYSLGEDSAAPGDSFNSKECNVYFELGDGKITDKVDKVSVDV